MHGIIGVRKNKQKSEASNQSTMYPMQTLAVICSDKVLAPSASPTLLRLARRLFIAVTLMARNKSALCPHKIWYRRSLPGRGELSHRNARASSRQPIALHGRPLRAFLKVRAAGAR